MKLMAGVLLENSHRGAVGMRFIFLLGSCVRFLVELPAFPLLLGFLFNELHFPRLQILSVHVTNLIG